MASGRQPPKDEDIRRLHITDLPALIDRAEAECWTALAIVPSGGSANAQVRSAERRCIPRHQIARIDQPIGAAGAKALSRLTNLRSLYLEGNQIGAAGAKALSRLTNLTSLYLWGNQIGAAGSKPLSQLTNLTSLYLEGNEIGDAGAEALSRLTNLTSLYLWGNQIGAAGAEALSRLTSLSSLNLGCNGIDDAGADALSRLTNLSSLELSKNQIGDAGAEALSRLINLTSLELSENHIGDAGAEALSRLTNLSSLELSKNQIGDAGAEALSRLINLTSLELSENHIGDAGAEALSRLTSLVSLNLGGNHIGDAGAEALSRLINLRSLYLWGTQIGDWGAEALSRLTNLRSLGLQENQIGDAGAEALSRLTNLSSLVLWENHIGDAGAEALSRLTNLSSLVLWENHIGDAGAEALSRMTNLGSLNLRGNDIGSTGARAILDAWANPATAEWRQELQLGDNNIGDLLPAEILEQWDAQAIVAAWRKFKGEETGRTPLPAPENVGKQTPLGAHVGIAPDGRLTTVDPALASGARDDALGRELHAESVAALDALILAAGRSNALTGWRQAAEDAKERLGDGPSAVRVSVILRIERLRALREADERRRREPDPLVEPAEPGVAAKLREAVAAANLYIETDPFLAGQQRKLADPDMQPALSLDEAATAEADLDAADIADDALLDELRNARETAESGGEAGQRAQVWLGESWRNVVIEATRQTLAWLRDATGQARIGTSITVDDAGQALETAGLRTKLTAMRVAKAAGESASRIWQHAEPELGKRLAQAAAGGAFVLFVGYNLPLAARLTANADLVAALQRLFGP